MGKSGLTEKGRRETAVRKAPVGRAKGEMRNLGENEAEHSPTHLNVRHTTLLSGQYTYLICLFCLFFKDLFLFVYMCCLLYTSDAADDHAV